MEPKLRISIKNFKVTAPLNIKLTSQANVVYNIMNRTLLLFNWHQLRIYTITLGKINQRCPFHYYYTGVCLGGKLSPFSDISQNSTLEKRTLHKIP